jgi:hypothetical protein
VRIRMQMLLTLAALLSSAAAIRATTLARLTLDQLTTAADAVARVRCAGAESRWENGAIWTVTTFDVVETMKGSLPTQVTVRLPGGRVGHLTAAVDGTPRFNAGDEAVVFLERYSGGLQVEPGPLSRGLQAEPGPARAGGFSVAGWVQGTFRIARDPRTGHETVTQDSSAFAVFDTATRAFRTEGIRHLPIEQFRERVAAALTRAQEKTR